MTPEGRVKKDIREYLTSLFKSGKPLFWDNRDAGGLSFKKGMPDLYCIYKGVHYEIEVKKEGGVQSTMQIKFQKILEHSGAIYILAESLEDVSSKIF